MRPCHAVFVIYLAIAAEKVCVQPLMMMVKKESKMLMQNVFKSLVLYQEVLIGIQSSSHIQ